MVRRLAPPPWYGLGGGGGGMNVRNLSDCRRFSTSQSQTCQQSRGLGVWNGLSSGLAPLLESDSVYKIQNMPAISGWASLRHDPSGCALLNV